MLKWLAAVLAQDDRIIGLGRARRYLHDLRLVAGHAVS
jgi:hypothetical protein